MVDVITNPVEALKITSAENSQLHEEVDRLYRELDWYRRGLEHIATIPTIAGQVATLILQKRPYKA